MLNERECGDEGDKVSLFLTQFFGFKVRLKKKKANMAAFDSHPFSCVFEKSVKCEKHAKKHVFFP